MKFFFFFLLSLLISCDEFYDEEFEEFQDEQARNVRNVSYTATLESSDSSLPELNGNATINVGEDEVVVDIQLSGIPQDIIQVHYSYIAADCDNTVTTLPQNTTTLRTYSINETTSVEALEEDLSSSGASAGEDDINLSGKSLIVKSFSNFSGIPGPTGTNVLTIACGELEINDGGLSNDQIITPPETTTSPDDRGDTGTDFNATF